MSRKKKILIIGGSGFIGFHLAKKCLKKSWSVTSISRKLPKKKRYLNRVNYILCDISLKKEISKKIDGNFDYVVNLGGEVDHSKNNKTYKSHFIGVKNISNFFINKKISKFLQIGSSTEYMSKSPQKENDLCMPVSIYGKSKLLATQHLINLHNEKKFPSLIFRLYQVYGPYQDLNRLIPIIINGCLKNKRFNCSSGIQNRDFLYVDDLITIILKALNSKIEGQIFNVGGGKKQNIKKVILKIKKIIKKENQYLAR